MPFPGLSGTLFYHALLVPYFTVFTLGYGTRVSGELNFPPTGPASFVSNHQSFLDPMLLGIAAYPRKLTFLARKQLFNHRLFGPYIRWCEPCRSTRASAATASEPLPPASIAAKRSSSSPKVVAPIRARSSRSSPASRSCFATRIGR